MANYTITLSEQTYHRLLAIAQENDTTPEAWLDAQLSPPPETPQPLPQLLTGLIGAIDSKAEPTPRQKQSKFGKSDRSQTC